MIKVPQTLGNETAEALNALIRQTDKIRRWDSFEIQNLLRVVEKLQKVDAREAFVRFGGIAAICGEAERVLEYFGKAQQHPDIINTNHEFWISLANIGLYKRAQEIGIWLLDPKRGFFPKAWERAVSIGLVNEVCNRLDGAKKLYPELEQIDFSDLALAREVMKTNDLTDQDVGDVLDLMGLIQREHGIMFHGAFAAHMKTMRPAEDPVYLYFTIPLDAEVPEIHSMNRELARRIPESLRYGAFPRGMVASFTKAIRQELLAAA